MPDPNDKFCTCETDPSLICPIHPEWTGDELRAAGNKTKELGRKEHPHNKIDDAIVEKTKVLKKLGRKYDVGKPRMELLQDFALALEQVGVVATIGAEKYDDGNWLRVENGAKRYTGAMLRHFLQEPFEREDKDGFLHAAAVAWNALARLELMLRGEEE